MILPWLGLVAPGSLQLQERTQPGTCHSAQRGWTPCRARSLPGHPCCYLQRPAPFQVCPESTPLSTVHPAWLHVASMPTSAACCGPQGLVTSIQGHPCHGLMLWHCHCHGSPCAILALVWCWASSTSMVRGSAARRWVGRQGGTCPLSWWRSSSSCSQQGGRAHYMEASIKVQPGQPSSSVKRSPRSAEMGWPRSAAQHH